MKMPPRTTITALVTIIMIAPHRSALADDEVPDDAIFSIVLEAANIVSFSQAFAPNTLDGWEFEDVVDEVFDEWEGDYDPFISFTLVIENTTNQPTDIRLNTFASMEPQFEDAPLSATMDVTLTDGTSQTDPDGNVSLTGAASGNPIASAFVRSFDGLVRSFGFFEQPLFADDLMTAGEHHDQSEGVIAFDAADALGPGIGFMAPWNEMLLNLEGTLSAGDTVEISGRFEANVTDTGPVVGDADGDGDVDAFDLGIWQTQFMMFGDDLSADFDDDGDVDGFDLGLWQTNFGTGVDDGAVPEPSTLALVLAGCLTIRRSVARRG